MIVSTLIKTGETIVQAVRDYPKGFLILAGVLILIVAVL
jgi:hypothetical protein